MSNSYIFSEEEVDRQAQTELRDEIRDLSSSLELAIQDLRVHADDDALDKMRMVSISLRLKAKSFNIKGLTAITHRLDEYLNGIKNLDERNIDDLQAFSDKISILLEDEDEGLENISDIVRALPHHSNFRIEDVEVSLFEVILVAPQKIAGKVVARELEACGYRVSMVHDPFEAMALILETMPDMIMTMMVMPRMSGTDLSCALAAMPTTKHIPLAVLTSLEPNHPDMKALPPNIGIIRRGTGFGDDLATFLRRFNIT